MKKSKKFTEEDAEAAMKELAEVDLGDEPAPGYIFVNDNSTGFYLTGSNKLTFTGGPFTISETITITSTSGTLTIVVDPDD